MVLRSYCPIFPQSYLPTPVSHTNRTHDCLIIGGGIIGLSLAYELGRAGLTVCVLDGGNPGREASWAGAGILPPGADSSLDPLERLIAHSSRRHVEWAARLREETGIDTGYRQCGGLYVARAEPEIEGLRRDADRLTGLGVELQWLSSDDVEQLEPVLERTTVGAYLLPQEAQLRNPRHLNALLAACRMHGVEVLAHTRAEAVRIGRGRVLSVRTPHGELVAGDYCLSAGSWSGELAAELRYPLAIKPIRGQMVLLKSGSPLIHRVVNHHLRYLVPRDDGRILVGSTMEDVGFDRSTTARGISGLLSFALDLAPPLAACAVERTWTGLRPAAADGLPILGRVPHLDNAWIATGHFRNGLTLSTATGEEMGRRIRGLPSTVDLAPYSPQRFVDEQPADLPSHRPPLATRGG